MAKKSKKNTESTAKQSIHVEGGIHAGRDVVQGDQINYGARDIQVTNITTPAEFVAKLGEIQAEIAVIKQQPDLSSAQKRNLEAAETQLAKATEEAQKPDADGSEIQATLTDVKDTFDLLTSSIASAAGLGAVLANVLEMVVKVFGG